MKNETKAMFDLTWEKEELRKVKRNLIISSAASGIILMVLLELILTIKTLKNYIFNSYIEIMDGVGSALIIAFFAISLLVFYFHRKKNQWESFIFIQSNFLLEDPENRKYTICFYLEDFEKYIEDLEIVESNSYEEDLGAKIKLNSTEIFIELGEAEDFLIKN